MVDNRSAGFFGIGGAFNFKSGDISGTAAKLTDEKMGQGGEYFSQRGGEEEAPAPANPYVDQSAVLKATLNSLAMMNVANVINARKKALEEQKEREKNKNNLKDESKQEQAEKDLEEEFYNLAREIKDDETDK